MSKPIKNMISRTYEQLFADADGAVLIDIRGVASNDNIALRNSLARSGVRVTVVKNSLAKRVFANTALGPVNELVDGPTAIVYGGESVVHVARELIEKAKGVANLDFKGAVMDGQLFGPDEIDALSKYPTREEAQGQVVQVVLTPGGELVSAVTSPGAQIASILSTIEEKLEGGEAIAKIA